MGNGDAGTAGELVLEVDGISSGAGIALENTSDRVSCASRPYASVVTNLNRWERMALKMRVTRRSVLIREGINKRFSQS